MSAKFAEGKEAIWIGTAGMFAQRVRIDAVRVSRYSIPGLHPDDREYEYDIDAPGIGIVYAIGDDELRAEPDLAL
jgi:hypothetical protein